MNILIVGGGGREHALAWKLASDSSSPDIFCAPGNAGTAAFCTNLDIGAEDVDALIDWADENSPGLAVIGPEVPLCMGIADRLEGLGVPVFGPSRQAARIEGSKVFAKDVMTAGGVPTARSGSFSDPDEARAYIREIGVPLVLKAEGLAAGKGVLICETMDDAEAAVQTAMVDREFGSAGDRVLIEEFLDGEEASIFAMTDGKEVILLASSQDHKRALDGDKGLNTGGMGAYSPAPCVTEDLWPVIREEVFERTLAELRKRDITYKGILYAGLMLTADGIRVLEFNCRFGDPETQCVLPRIEGDLLPAMQACAEGRLQPDMITWKQDHGVVVVMAAGGYPGRYNKGDEITGLDKASAMEDVTVFHAGTRLDDAGRVVTSGGRVLGVTALGPTLEEAVSRAYAAVDTIHFKDALVRRDIAHRALT
jgi:phosphoribosylamine--glycine ligase